jgi:hypothetical protein
MPEVHVNTGVTGAKRQSWKRANPTAVMLRVATDNPDWDETANNAAVWTIVHGDPAQMKTIFDYWHRNNWRRLVELPRRAGDDTQAEAPSADPQAGDPEAAQPSNRSSAASSTAETVSSEVQNRRFRGHNHPSGHPKGVNRCRSQGKGQSRVARHDAPQRQDAAALDPRGAARMRRLAYLGGGGAAARSDPGGSRYDRGAGA